VSLPLVNPPLDVMLSTSLLVKLMVFTRPGLGRTLYGHDNWSVSFSTVAWLSCEQTSSKSTKSETKIRFGDI